MKHIIFLLSVITLYSCSCKDVEPKHAAGKAKSILILGNSLVSHPSLPSIGWYGNWGMAASCADSDFVHILIRDVREKDSSVSFKYKNIADFEANYNSYNLSQLDSLCNPDILVIKISENVKADASFKSAYEKMVNYINKDKKTTVIIGDGFWNNSANAIIKDYASVNEFPFVTITDLSQDPTNKAGQFKDAGVAAHPSDKGMRLIAGRIWAVLKNYL